MKVAGLILDSGLMELKSLPVVQQMSNVIPNGSQILSIFPDPLGSYDKLAVVTCPVLSLHSLQDEVVPYAQAQECHNRLVNCKQKTLKGFAQSGHNDVISRHMARASARRPFSSRDGAAGTCPQKRRTRDELLSCRR